MTGFPMHTFGQPPYCAQWASASWVSDFLTGARRVVDDPLWADFGAQSPQEYEFWSWHACGMACTWSVLSAVYGQSPPVVQLARQVWGAGGYQAAPSGVRGLVYAPYVEYLKARWGIHAQVAAPCLTSHLASVVAGGAWALASVHPSIRRAPALPPSRGGHLVLVFASADGALTFHNPSGTSPETQRSARLPVEVFDQFYAGRAVVLHSGPHRMRPLCSG